MTVRQAESERAALVSLSSRNTRAIDPDITLDELAGLALAAGAQPVLRVTQDRQAIDPATLIGKGKAAALARACDEAKATIVIFDNDLTPAQARNLEKTTGRRVVDRTELILDIFARRARTREGQLQVELAQLQYLLPRLTGAGAELSRLGGGIGTRGPGETKLETDRRRIRHRIASLKRDIDQVGRRRGFLRARRHRGDVPTVALVGYTNAGKTTLFNLLTGDTAEVSNALFVTLDPLVRRVKLADARQVLVSDTVGFIDRLPHQLVAAFHATLEEVTGADLLLHVIDASAPDRDRRERAVRSVLAEIGADRVPIVDAFNKMDLVPADEAKRLVQAHPDALFITATRRRGRRALVDEVTRRLRMDAERVQLELRDDLDDDRKLVADLYRHARVISHTASGGRVSIEADVPKRLMARLTRTIALLLVAAFLGACAGTTIAPAVPAAPRYADYPKPDVPTTLRIETSIRRSHDEAWTRLQAGDLRGAERAFSDIVRRSPAFYPSETGLGFTLLAERQHRQAAARFSAVIGKNDRYLPAWVGQGEAQLALGNDAGALSAFERVVVLDPRRESARSRVELLKFRQIQTLIQSARKSRDGGRFDDARSAFENALALSPSSGMILRELAAVEVAQGALDSAENHARRAIQADPDDAEALATLGSVLEARGRLREASAAYAAAIKIDPRPAWKERNETLKDKAVAATIPPEFRSLPSAATVSRAQLAALIGMRLEPVLARAPRRVANVATDIKGQWAEPWILTVTQTGVMDVQPNHTFQPAGTIRRSDLAQVVAHVLALLSNRQSDVAKWRVTRPRFVDLPTGNINYSAAALAVSSAAMTAQDGNRFSPTRAATGAEVLAAVSRLEQLAGNK
jgi:GTPase